MRSRSESRLNSRKNGLAVDQRTAMESYLDESDK